MPYGHADGRSPPSRTGASCACAPPPPPPPPAYTVADRTKITHSRVDCRARTQDKKNIARLPPALSDRPRHISHAPGQPGAAGRAQETWWIRVASLHSVRTLQGRRHVSPPFHSSFFSRARSRMEVTTGYTLSNSLATASLFAGFQRRFLLDSPPFSTFRTLSSFPRHAQL